VGKYDKSSEIEILPNDPFANDLFNRKKLIEPLTRFIISMEKPFVLSVEAPWGHGKTTFVKMWQQKLKNDGKIVLYYNAWENDYTDDPLSNFVVSLSSQISDTYGEFGVSNLFKQLAKTTGKLTALGLPILLGILSRGIIDQKTTKSLSRILKPSDIEKLVSTASSELVESVEKQIETNKSFKSSLSDLTKILHKKNKLPLIIFIDELDRCRPDFALSLLERIKHLFSVEGIVFVLSIERKQLETSIKSIYGNEMDVNNYLRRFIDLRLKLENPKNNIVGFVKKEIYSIGLADILNIRETNYESYGKALDAFSKNFPLSLRAMKQIIYNFNIIARTISPQLKNLIINNRLYWDFILYLLILKSIDEKIIIELSKGNIEALQEFEKSNKNFIVANDEILDWGWFYGHIIPYSKASKEITDLENIIQTNPYDTEENQFRKRKIESLEDQIKYRPLQIDYCSRLINAINLTNLIIPNGE
jgi:hypothetical protein